jgi:hypothetical protein
MLVGTKNKLNWSVAEIGVAKNCETSKEFSQCNLSVFFVHTANQFILYIHYFS